jgi:hypothetical protein
MTACTVHLTCGGCGTSTTVRIPAPGCKTPLDAAPLAKFLGRLIVVANGGAVLEDGVMCGTCVLWLTQQPHEEHA